MVERLANMKRLPRIAIAALAVAGFVSASADGQGNGTASRGLIVKYAAGKIDGMQVSILKKSGDKQIAVDPSTTFRTGEEIWVEFMSNFDGYVYIVNVRPEGGKRVLYPYRATSDKEASNKISADRRYTFPEGDAFAFDQETGTEILQVIMSHDSIPYLDAAVNNPNGDLGDSASSAAAELQGRASKPVNQNSSSGSDGGGIVTENVVLPEGVQTRDIRRVSLAHSSARTGAPATGKHKVERRGSVVAIPDNGRKGGKLKSGDLAVFEIRLKHV
jgi:hypothetical protein